MSRFGGLGIGTLMPGAQLRQQGLQHGIDSLSRSLQFGASLYHDSAEKSKDRKAQEDAKKKAKKEQKKALATSLGIGAGAAVIGAGLGAALAPALAATPAAGAGVVAPTTAGLESAGTVATGEAIAQSAATAAGATTVGAVPATLSAPLATAGLTAGQTSGLAGSIGAIGAGGGAAGGAGTGALIGGGAGFAGGTGAGLSTLSPQEPGSISTPSFGGAGGFGGQGGAGGFSGGAGQFSAPNINQLAKQGGYGVSGAGDRLKLFGALAGRNLLNTVAPGSGDSLNGVINSPQFNFQSAVNAGTGITNLGLNAARLGEDQRQFNTTQAGIDRRFKERLDFDKSRPTGSVDPFAKFGFSKDTTFKDAGITPPKGFADTDTFGKAATQNYLTPGGSGGNEVPFGSHNVDGYKFSDEEFLLIQDFESRLAAAAAEGKSESEQLDILDKGFKMGALPPKAHIFLRRKYFGSPDRALDYTTGAP